MSKQKIERYMQRHGGHNEAVVVEDGMIVSKRVAVVVAEAEAEAAAVAEALKAMPPL